MPTYHKSLAGVGWISLVPGGSNPDPVVLAEVDELGFDSDESQEDLEDENGDVIDAFVTKRVISGTISLKDFANSLLAMVTRGVTITPGRPIGYTHSAAIPATPFQITVPLTAPTRTFTQDMGVIDLTAGKAMTCDATATGAGVYAVDSAGQYTFNTADTGHTVLIYYRATPSTADGTTAAIATSASEASKYGLHFYNTKAGKSFGLYVPQALIPGISGKFAKGSWVSSSLKWKATKDSNGKLTYWYLPE